MIVRKILFLVLILIAFRMNAYPQLNEIGKFELESWKDRKVIVSFKLINNLIVVPISINGSDTLHFVLDTGVGSTLITEFPSGTEIGFNYLRTVKITGLGEGESIDVLYSPNNVIEFGKAVGRQQDILVMTEDVFQLSSLLGTNVHGLIGFALFKDLIVEIDYEENKLILHEYHKYIDRYKDKQRSGKWTSMPLTIYKQKPYIDVEIEQKDGTKEQVKLLLDSGASHGMALYYSANEKIHLPEARMRSFLGSGISGEINGYLGKIESLSIDGNIMEDVVVAYPDEEGIKQALLYSDRDGSIGAEVMRRFKFFFNYRDSSMIMRRDNDFDEDFSYNLSGIEIAAPYPNIPLYAVTHVRKSSVAEKAGVLPDDLILEINGKGVQSFGLSDIHRLFQKPGQKVWLKLMRGEEYIIKEFYQEDELE
ncbi:MAG: aspartyl protease family protein [Balneola sp.]